MTAKGLFTGERALVTGSASSIGRGIAIALAREGANVILADVDMERNAAVAREISNLGTTPETITVDLSQPDGWKEVINAIEGEVPHMMVHAASPPRVDSDTPLTVSEATWDAMLTTNLRAGFFLGRDIGARMREAGIKGRMLYVTSLHAETPRNLAHYSAAKAGTTMAMKELARALGPAGIRVNALAPGAVPGGGAANMDDSFKPKQKIALQRFGTPDDMAGMALALLSNRFSGYVTGVTVPVDGGLALFNWIPAPDQA